MKKITKLSAISLLALTAMGLPLATNAKMVDADYIKELSKVVDGSEVIGYNNVYFFGKYAFVNSLTTADLVKAANTLEGATDAVLYLKDTNNTWKNAVDTSKTFKASDLSFNLVKIFGVDSTVAATEATKDDVEKENATTLVFEDAAANVKLSTVKKINVLDSIGDNQIDATIAQNYNISKLNVELSGTTIKVNETAPLVQYVRNNVNAKHYGLVFKMNKAFDATKVKFEIAEKDKLTAAAVKEATKYGTGSNEFVVWFTAGAENATTTDTAITMKEYDENNELVNTTTYKLSFTSVNYITTTAADSKAHTIVPESTELKVAEYKKDTEYEYLFYTEKKTATAKFNFTDNGYKKLLDGTTINEVNQFKSITLAEYEADKVATADYDWNQSAVEISTVAKDLATDKCDYEVTITRNKELKGTEFVTLVADFGYTQNANARIDKTDAGANFVVDETSKKVTVKATKEGYKVVFKDATDVNNKIVVKFTFVDAVTKLVPTAKAAALTDVANGKGLYIENLDNDKRVANTKYDNAVSSAGTPVVTSNDDKTVYYVNLYAVEEIVDEYSNGTTNAKQVPVVLNFGVPVENITFGATTPEKDHIARFGANEGSEVVVWVTADAAAKQIEATNKLNNSKITVNVKLSNLTMAVVTVPATYDNVELSAPVIKTEGVALATTATGKKVFKVYDATLNQFVVTDGNAEYTFTKEWVAGETNDYSTTWTSVKSIKLAGFQKIDAAKVTGTEDNDKALKYNLSSIESLSRDTKEENKLVVNFNRALSNGTEAANKSLYTQTASGTVTGLDADIWYQVAINLGINAYKDGAAVVALADNANAKMATLAETRKFLGLAADADPESVLVWVKKSDETISLTFNYAAVATSKVTSTIKVAAKDLEIKVSGLEVNAAGVATVDVSKVNETADTAAMITNAKAIKSVKVDAEGKVVITSKMLGDNFKKFTNDADYNDDYIGILLDLGVAPYTSTGVANIALTGVSTSGTTATVDAKIQANETEGEKTLVNKLRGTNGTSTSFVLWIKKSALAADKKLKFYNLTEDNKFDTKEVTFALEYDLADLELTNISILDAGLSIDSNDAMYDLNQNMFKREYNAEYNATTKALEYKTTASSNTLSTYSVVSEYNVDGTVKTRTPGNWVAVLVDFGKEVIADKGAAAGLVEVTDIATLAKFGATETEKVYYVDLAAGKMADATVTFTDQYTGKTTTLKFDNVSNN